MANDCLVTQLKGSVDNNNLYILGEFRVHPGSSNGFIRLRAKTGKTVTVSTSDGQNHLANVLDDHFDGNFNASSVTVPDGISTIVGIQPGSNYFVRVIDKNDLDGITFGYHGGDAWADLDELQLTQITLFAINAKSSDTLTKAPLVEGMAIAIDSNAPVDFDISQLAAISNYYSFSINGRSVVGDLGLLTGISLVNKGSTERSFPSRVWGDIVAFTNAVFASNVEKVTCEIDNAGIKPAYPVTGDLSLLPSSLVYFGISRDFQNTNFTWEHQRTPGSRAISFKGNDINLGNYLDTALKNIAQLDFTNPFTQWDKYIQLQGVHDPNDTAAEAAIATIKAAGWTVTLNGVDQ